MSTFRDMILAVLAEQPAGPTPAQPGVDDFGSDLSCAADCTPMFDELAGDDPEIVAQAFVRWLQTEPGSLPDLEVTDWGGGLLSMLRRPMTTTEIASIPGRLRSKWLDDDDRTEDISISRPVDVGGGQYLIDVRGVTTMGPFALTLAATSTEVILKAMSTP